MEIPKRDIGNFDYVNRSYHRKKARMWWSKYAKSSDIKHHERFKYHNDLDDYYFKKMCASYANHIAKFLKKQN